MSGRPGQLPWPRFCPRPSARCLTQTAASPAQRAISCPFQRSLPPPPPPLQSTPKKAGAPGAKKAPASSRPKVTAKAKPLSPGSNYPATKNIQVQASGFGNFLQRFQTVSGKSKYGVPIFLPSGESARAQISYGYTPARDQASLGVGGVGGCGGVWGGGEERAECGWTPRRPQSRATAS